jgi:hypothetical protein
LNSSLFFYLFWLKMTLYEKSKYVTFTVYEIQRGIYGCHYAVVTSHTTGCHGLWFNHVWSCLGYCTMQFQPLKLQSMNWVWNGQYAKIYTFITIRTQQYPIFRTESSYTYITVTCFSRQAAVIRPIKELSI